MRALWLLLPACWTTAPAPTASPASKPARRTVCDGPTVKLHRIDRKLDVGARFEVPHESGSTEIGYLLWADDLDGNGAADLALRIEGSCGNRGDCLNGVYAGCGRDEYVVVVEPGYYYDLAVLQTRSARGWKALRSGELGEHGERLPVSFRWEIEGDRYRMLGSR
jgi:hypothetical protein